MANSAFPQEGSAGMRLDVGKVWLGTTGGNAPSTGRQRIEAWRGIFMARLCGASLKRLS
jgi:hypothetical protein